MENKKSSISDLILLVLEKTVDGYCRFEDFTYHHYRYHYGIPDLKKSSLSQALRRLRIGGYIDKEISEGRVIYKLTSFGKETLGHDYKPWDGKWRIVIFDIPEKKRAIRDLLRRRLKDWEFKAWQRSVWITKRDITANLRKLIDDLDIEQWVAVVESDDPALHYIIFNDRGT